ncbi:MAG: inorganic phosphate transporter [Dermatophilaceae bacterium]
MTPPTPSSTVVATRALPAKWAVWFSAFFNFAAVFIVGTAVANTVAKTVKADFTGIAVVFAALFAAIAWNYATWWVGMPSSSSHALIGGLVGAGLAAGGMRRHLLVERAEDRRSRSSISPARRLRHRVPRDVPRSAAIRKATEVRTRTPSPSSGCSWSRPPRCPSVTAPTTPRRRWASSPRCSSARGTSRPPADGNVVVPVWVEFAAYGAIALGTVWGGWKIIETMGLKITTLHASSGVAANVGAVTAIFGATGLGVPISTTHAAASSVAGAGVASGVGINLKVVGEMVMAWVITVPSTVIVGFLAFKSTQLPGAFALDRHRRRWSSWPQCSSAGRWRTPSPPRTSRPRSPTEEDLEKPLPSAPRTSRATARPPERRHGRLRPAQQRRRGSPDLGSPSRRSSRCAVTSASGPRRRRPGSVPAALRPPRRHRPGRARPAR